MLDQTDESRAMTKAERQAEQRRSPRVVARAVEWDEHRIAELTRLWADGNSATEIANELGGGLTRSAVLGKVHRLKLPKRLTLNFAVPKPKHHGNRGQPKANAIIARKARKSADLVPAPTIAEPAADEPAVTSNVIKLIDLTKDTCRFPIGDPKVKGFGFCGHPPKDGKVYCAEHAAIAYAGVTPGYAMGKRK